VLSTLKNKVKGLKIIVKSLFWCRVRNVRWVNNFLHHNMLYGEEANYSSGDMEDDIWTTI
jgi:hypothetical protein